MHVGGIYFINHKAKDYFTEGALKEWKSHDSQLFLGDTHDNREDYHRRHPAGKRRPGDVPWRSPNSPLKVLTPGTYRRPTKKLMIYEKIVFQM